MSEIFRNVEGIVEGLDKEISEDVMAERVLLPEERLRNALLGLVEKQVKEACNYDEAINLAVSSVKDKIVTNELTTSELLNVISTLSNKKVDLIATTLEPFKPTPNGVSLLLPPIREREKEDDFSEGMKNVTGEELEVLNNLFKALKR